MNAEFLEQLLHEDESTSLDFKREQYPFSNASDNEKSELLKDIIGFANAWRRATAYILIGVDEVAGGRSNVIGITDHLPDHTLQQFVNSRTNRPIRFGYETCSFEGKQVGVIRIELQPRLFYLNRNYGKLTARDVYVRRGSSTDPSKPATPEEIAEMGKDSPVMDDFELDIQFADADHDNARGTRMPWSAEYCQMPAPKDIPGLSQARNYQYHPIAIKASFMDSFLAASDRGNENYYRDLAEFVRAFRLWKPIRIVVENKGKSAAKNVRIEITVAAHKGLGVNYPSVVPDIPDKKRSIIPNMGSIHDTLASLSRAGRVEINENDDRYILEIECGDLQPGRKVWSDAFNIAIIRDGLYSLEGLAFAANLTEPKRFLLEIDAEIRQTSMTIRDLLRLHVATEMET